MKNPETEVFGERGLAALEAEFEAEAQRLVRRGIFRVVGVRDGRRVYGFTEKGEEWQREWEQGQS